MPIIIAEITENAEFLRNEKNYEEDLQILDVSANGIKENSIFNEIANFHIMKNYSVDIIHDLLEGVCCYDLTII